MTHLRPCRGCRFRETCQLKAELHQLLRSAPVRLTLANFACGFRLDGLAPGTVVEVDLPDLVPMSQWGREEAHYLVTSPDGRRSRHRAVVMEEAGGKRRGRLRLWALEPVDEGGDTYQQIFHAMPDRLRPTGESVPLCADCQRPMDAPLSSWPAICETAGQHFDTLESARAAHDSFNRNHLDYGEPF